MVKIQIVGIKIVYNKSVTHDQPIMGKESIIISRRC